VLNAAPAAVLAPSDADLYTGRMPDSPRKLIAVFNSSDDLVELLRIVLEQNGFVVVTGHISELRHGKLDIRAFVEQYKPAAILYDLIPPYDRHWAFVDHMRGVSPLKGVPFILTSTNAGMARQLAGRTEPVIEVLGRPFDLEEIVDAVKRTVGT
jgi:DNA-binding NtrC family response regulator